MKHLLFCTARIIDEIVLLPFFCKIFAVAHCLLLLSSSVLSFFTFLGFFYIYICDLFLSLSVQIERIRYILSKNLGKLAFVKLGRAGGGWK